MNINLKDYIPVIKQDIVSGEYYGIILLNKKHTVSEFQKAIYDAQEQARDEINENGDDWYYIDQIIGKKFDYIEIEVDFNCDENYIEF